MISSSPAFLKCYQCKKSPKQFTFLLCNHIICDKCISKKIEFGDKYNSVMCSCGSLTYFNEDSQIVEEEDYDIQNGQVQNSNKAKQQAREFLTKGGLDANQRKSTTADHRNSFSKNLSNQTIENYSKTLINQRSTMPMLSVSQVFSLEKNDSSQQNKKRHHLSPKKQQHMRGSLLTSQMRNKLEGTDKTAYDQSLLLDNYQAYEPTKKRNVDPLRTINQFSTHQIRGTEIKEKDNQGKLFSPKMFNDVKTIKESIMVNNIDDSNNRRVNNSTTTKVKLNLFQPHFNNNKHFSTPNLLKPHHSQFQSELSFLKIMFQKDLQQIEFHFRKLINQLTTSFSSLEEQIRSLYVQEVISKESFVSLNLSSLIKNKYDKVIGDKFRKLKDQLFLPFYMSENKHNQNILLSIQNKVKNQSISSPLLEAYKLNCNIKPANQKDSTSQSQIFQNSSQQDQNNLQKFENETQKLTTTMNHRIKIPQFQTVEQKFQRLTTKPRKTQKKQTDLVKVYNQQSSKRIQTENIHTSINRNQSYENLIEKTRKQKTHHHHHNNTLQNPPLHQYNSPQPQYRLTEKPVRTSLDQKRRQIIYYSPPVPYCYKHLQKKQKQARNYISYIEKLCHEKKMKNNHELFKKVKTKYQFCRENN